jgi:hypothetical protein
LRVTFDPGCSGHAGGGEAGATVTADALSMNWKECLEPSGRTHSKRRHFPEFVDRVPRDRTVASLWPG